MKRIFLILLLLITIVPVHAYTSDKYKEYKDFNPDYKDFSSSFRKLQYGEDARYYTEPDFQEYLHEDHRYETYRDFYRSNDQEFYVRRLPDYKPLSGYKRYNQFVVIYKSS